MSVPCVPYPQDAPRSLNITQDPCITCKRTLCAFLPEASLDLRHRSILHLGRGDRIDDCHDAGFKFWVIVDGTAATCMPFPDGRRQIAGIELSGDIVNGLNDSEDAPVWLEALEPTTVCELNFADLGQKAQADPSFLTEISQVLQQRLETASRHLATLGRLDSTERVTLFLAQMAVRSDAPGQPVRLPMSREDIADYLGLNAETVSRIFSRVKKSGLVKFLSPTEYVIPDMGAVQRRLPFPIPPTEQVRAPRRLRSVLRKAIA